jgi:hypothetical protein
MLGVPLQVLPPLPAGAMAWRSSGRTYSIFGLIAQKFVAEGFVPKVRLALRVVGVGPIAFGRESITDSVSSTSFQ